MNDIRQRTSRLLTTAMAIALALATGLLAPTPSFATTPGQAETPLLALSSSTALTSDSSNAIIPQGLTALSVDDTSYAPESSFPTTYDLRDQGLSSGVRDQSPWGTCWIFGTVASAESNIMRQTGREADLSERQLAYFSKTKVNSSTTTTDNRTIDPDQYGEGSINGFNGGGETFGAGQLLTTWQGIATEAAIPYLASDGSLSSEESPWGLDESKRFLAVAHATDASQLQSPTSYSEDLTADEKAYNATAADGDKILRHTTFNSAGVDSIKRAVMNVGAVAISYHADQSRPAAGTNSAYFNYETGGYYIPELTANTWANHIITVIGWDDDFKATDFGGATPPGDGAFLCKNSWGTGSWGVLDYFFEGSKVLPKYNQDDNTYNILTTDGSTLASGLTFTGYDEGAKTYHFADSSGKTYDVTFAPRYPDSPTWKGYFWLSYHDATICDALSVTMDIADVSGNFSYDHIYEYDYLGQASPLVTTCGDFDSTTPVQAANVFTVQANESVGAVSAATAKPGSTVKVSVYRLANDATGPTQSASGTPEATATETFDEAGYHTIKLGSAMNLHAGERFSVVETITSADGGYLPIELAQQDLAGHDTVAKAGKGESYLSEDGGATWVDASTLTTANLSGKTEGVWTTDAADKLPDPTDLTSIGNVEIRAFTTDWSPDPTFVDGTKTGVSTTGLDGVAAAVAQANPSARSTTVTLDIENADAAGSQATAIRSLPSASGLAFDAFYDATLTQTVDGVTTNIGQSNDALVGVVYPYDFTGKGAVHAFGFSDGEAYEITATLNAMGEYLVANPASGTVTIYSKRFSSFAIAHAVVPATNVTNETKAPVGVVSASVTSEGPTPATGDGFDGWSVVMTAAAGTACLVVARRRRSRATASR